MPNLRTETVTKHLLELDDSELNWLRGYLQNSPFALTQGGLEEESPEDAKMRLALFEELGRALIG